MIRARFVAAAVAALLGACSTEGGREPAAAPKRTTSTTSAASVLAATAEDPGKVAHVADVPASARAGSRVTATFLTRPGTSCSAVAHQPGGSDETLAPMAADASGKVTWTWVIDPSAAGTVTVSVVCSGGDRGQAEIAVA